MLFSHEKILELEEIRKRANGELGHNEYWNQLKSNSDRIFLLDIVSVFSLYLSSQGNNRENPTEINSQE